MLIEGTKYVAVTAVSEKLDGNNVFRFCDFHGFSIEGGHVDGAFIDCSFENLEWYWTLFNSCLFVRCRIVSCEFRGIAFTDCRFVDCEFLGCRFLRNNLETVCTAKGARVYGSTAKECEGADFLFAPDAV